MKNDVSSNWQVTRKLYLPNLNNASQAEHITHCMMNKKGVLCVAMDVARGHITIKYNAAEVTFFEIIEVLDQEDMPVLKNTWFRLKQFLYEYTERNIRDSAQASPASCCNRPPVRSKTNH